jgi:hypothetical protein
MKVYNNMKLLKNWFNPEASKVMEGLISGREEMLEGADIAFFLTDNSGEPTKFHEAYNHPKPDARVKWRVAICEAIEDMKNKGEWEVIQRRRYRRKKMCKKQMGIQD